MKGLKKISIIIATYNASLFLSRVLDSIKIQKEDDIELLVIDGLSSDNTIDIIKEYEEIIDIWVSESDKGIYDAWNKGINLSTGEWIMFLGADDILQPNALFTYLNFINSHDCSVIDIICAKLEFVNYKGEHLRVVGEPWNWNKMVNRKLSFAHPGLLHKRRLFDHFGVFDIKYKICADSDFFQRIGPNIKSEFIDVIMVKMQQGGMSDSYAALKEGYMIRKNNKVISPFLNMINHFFILFRYTFSRFKRILIK